MQPQKKKGKELARKLNMKRKMRTRNNVEKNIAKQIKDNPIKNKIKKGLILNTSYDDFELGHKISKYVRRPHYIHKWNDPFQWDCYTFIQEKNEIELFCEDKIIKSICCNESCIYKGKELIKMDFQEFIEIIEEEPASHDIEYVVVTKDRGQNQHVYEFDKSGLQIWVWRNKIRTVIISNSEDEESNHGVGSTDH